MAVNLLLRTVSGHRNIKISGDGLVALKLSMFFHNLFSQIYRQLFTLLSFLHAQCDTNHRFFFHFFGELHSLCISPPLLLCSHDLFIISCFLFLLLPLSHIHPYIDYRLYNYLMLHPIPSPKVPNGAVFSAPPDWILKSRIDQRILILY